MEKINFTVLAGTEISSNGLYNLTFHMAVNVEKNATMNSIRRKKSACFEEKNHRR